MSSIERKGLENQKHSFFPLAPFLCWSLPQDFPTNFLLLHLWAVQLCLANMPLGMKETREDVICLFGLLGSQTISFFLSPTSFFHNGLLWRKIKSLWWSRLWVSLHAPACSSTTALAWGTMLDVRAWPFPPVSALGSLLAPMTDNTSSRWSGQFSVDDTETETLGTTCKEGQW